MKRSGKLIRAIWRLRDRGHGFIACRDEGHARELASKFRINVYEFSSEVEPDAPSRWFVGLGESEGLR